MSDTSKTLHEIRSEACDKILLTFTLLGIPTVAGSLMRVVEQGWKSVMGLHVALILVLIAVTFFRQRLGLFVRAATITAIPFIAGVGSLVTYGRIGGTLMLFVTSCVIAACFFNRRIALGVVALGVASLAATYICFRVGVLALQIAPGSYEASVITWITIAGAFVFAGTAPVIALSAVYQALESERVRANTAANARTAFLANMSHELRTPMAGIIGMAELLRATRLDAHQQTVTENLMRSSRNLLNVLNDVLDFAKFESGNVPIEKVAFKLSETIGHICAVFETRAAQGGLDFKITFPDRFQDDVIGDPHRIGQVLSNLIGNAMKFTERGSITVSVGQMPLADRMVLLTCAVTDTGIGISPEQSVEIFKPFVQADASTSRKYGGSGLGLAICRDLMKAMGGDIAVASRPGEGATFTIEVPLETQMTDAMSLLPPLAQGGGTAADAARPLNVLAAEDDANMRLLLEIRLPQMGHIAKVVADGDAAVRAVRDGAYDCILMDMHMPTLNGPDAIRAIRAVEAAKGVAYRTPIIAVTADLPAGRIRELREAGVDAVVGKPVNWKSLETRILQVTRQGAGGAA